MTDEQLFEPTFDDLKKVFMEVGKKKQKELEKDKEYQELNKKYEESKRGLMEMRKTMLEFRKQSTSGNSSKVDVSTHVCESCLEVPKLVKLLFQMNVAGSVPNSEENNLNGPAPAKPDVRQNARKNGKSRKNQKHGAKPQKQEKPEEPSNEPIREASTSAIQPEPKKTERKFKRNSK